MKMTMMKKKMMMMMIKKMSVRINSRATRLTRRKKKVSKETKKMVIPNVLGFSSTDIDTSMMDVASRQERMTEFSASTHLQGVVLKSQKCPSVYYWWEEEIAQNQFTVVVIFKSVNDPEDESYLKRWDDVADLLLRSKTLIYAVSTQKQMYLDKARTQWRLGFDLISDQDATLAKFHDVPLSEHPFDPTRKSANPAVLLFGQLRDKLFKWKARTSALRSTTERPDPFDIALALSRARGTFTRSTFLPVRFGEPVTKSGWHKWTTKKLEKKLDGLD